VADYGTDGWAAEVSGLWADLPEAPGAEGTLALAVAIAPRRDVTLHWTYRGGKVVSGGAGPGEAPALTLSLGVGDGPEVLSGRVEPSVAFMRGRLKATGEGAVLLAFLGSTATAGFQRWRAKVEALSPLPT
jgi:hypothetical protein